VTAGSAELVLAGERVTVPQDLVQKLFAFGDQVRGRPLPRDIYGLLEAIGNVYGYAAETSEQPEVARR
jgi:hypothetical protein